MNQEAHMQDADSGSREFVLQISGPVLMGDYGTAGQATLRQISGLVPLAELVMEDRPDRSIILTDPTFWNPDGRPAKRHTGAEEQGVFHWKPLEMEADSCRVRMNPAVTLVMENSGAAVWREEPAAGDSVELHSLQRLVFPDGLLGLTEWKEFLLFYQYEGESIGVLIPLASRSVSLAVVDPFQVLPDYQPSRGEVESGELDKEGGEPLHWLSILNIQNDPFEVFVNLLGPLVFNPRTGWGKQVVLSNSGYSASYRLGQLAGLDQER
ncbi:MAG: flagellar assembly protein FliW [Anaerolineales bacterium]|nr:flagellar assembly protein FliW [Anaerolineales bacterium]